MLRLVTTILTARLLMVPASATNLFSSGAPDGKIGMATRIGPGSGANQETEAADDFVLTWPLTIIDSATFIGLLPANVDLQTGISQVTVEIYRVFPKDSDTGRTSGPPTFSTAQVPTRVNSPSDVEFVDRSVSGGTLSFTVTQMNPVFTVSNSVDTGIHLGTGGDGPVTVQEVEFTVTFAKPLLLPADHYFFVPQSAGV